MHPATSAVFAGPHQACGRSLRASTVQGPYSRPQLNERSAASCGVRFWQTRVQPSCCESSGVRVWLLRLRCASVNGPTVLLADALPWVRADVAERLLRDHDIDVVATADDLASTMLQASRTSPEVVVVSTSLMSALPELCRQLRGMDQPPRILVADEQPDEHALLEAIEAGADGYTSGAYGVRGLAAAIRAVDRGESVVPAAMLGPLLRRLIQRQREAAEAADRLVRLTPREREVLSLLAEGLDQQGIAAALVISPETARTHLQRVLRKLGVHSRTEAVALIVRTGLADRLERIIERSAS